jgi:hypothetical protein
MRRHNISSQTRYNGGTNMAPLPRGSILPICVTCLPTLMLPKMLRISLGDHWQNFSLPFKHKHTYLRMRRHSDILLRRNRILRAPKARNSLPLRVEAQTIFPVEIARPRTRHALLVPREAEHGQRDGDGDVDPQLAGFDLLLEAGGGGAGFGEDGGAVAVFVCVDQVDGFVGCFDV